jgi:citrate synthase
MKMLLEIGSVENTEKWFRDALASKRTIMGFGHREYKNGDPRARILTQLAQEVAKELNQPKWAQMAEIAERIMLEEKGLHPNLDFPIGYIYYMLGLPTEIYTPIFAIGRVAGWTSHIIEQLDHNRLIRPSAIYNGEEYRPYVPLNKR